METFLRSCAAGFCGGCLFWAGVFPANIPRYLMVSGIAFLVYYTCDRYCDYCDRVAG